MKKIITPLFYLFLILVFFWQFFVKGFLPIPADTIVGMYYPFRDIYASTNPNGIPFKNFMITDPVRQQYPWKELSISLEKKFQLPLWNPYNFMGSPLLANSQSGVFYPLNLVFFIFPMYIAWSIFIFLQPLLGGGFLYLYLRNLKLSKESSILGSISFAFSGFCISWLQWGNIVNTALWLPLILFLMNKILTEEKKKVIWHLLLIFAYASSFFAGHLQVFLYVFLTSIIYFILYALFYKKKTFHIKGYLIDLTILILITAVQWIPTFRLIFLSARNIDQSNWHNAGWFVPWQNIVQFFVPDFFGNPATLNYWGVWNYGEFVGYIGVASLIFALYALFFRRDRKTLFFGTLFFVSLIFAFPWIISKIPYKFSFPFISTSQPTRLMFLADFSLSILAALGFDYFFRAKKKKEIFYILGFLLLVLTGLWLFVILGGFGLVKATELLVTKSNLLLPTALFVAVSLILIFYMAVSNKKVILLVKLLIILVLIFDLFRFGWKYLPFSNKAYLFPETEVTSFLKQNIGIHRVMATDSSIFPPNFSIIYKIQTADGYDPLYLLRYAELIAANERERPNISPPFGFNRIINPQHYQTRLINLFGIKYVLSFTEISGLMTNLEKVFSHGKIIIYENKTVLPRAFFVENTVGTDDKQKTIELMLDIEFKLHRSAILEKTDENKSVVDRKWKKGKIKIINYSENEIKLETTGTKDGFLVLTDSYYPSWKATIDGKETKIYLTDYNFRGIVVPSGKHIIEFNNYLF